MIAMLSNQMFYRTVEEIGNDCYMLRLVMIAMLRCSNQMFYRTVEEIGNDCNVKQSDVLQNC